MRNLRFSNLIAICLSVILALTGCSKNAGFEQASHLRGTIKSEVQSAYKAAGVSSSAAISFPSKSLSQYYSEIGYKHNQNLGAMYTYLQGKNAPGAINTYASYIRSQSLSYIKTYENAGAYLTDYEWTSNLNTDILNPEINNQPISVTEVSWNVVSKCRSLKTYVENSSNSDVTQMKVYIDQFYNNNISSLSTPEEQIAFTSFASTLKSSLEFWVNKGSVVSVSSNYKKDQQMSMLNPTPPKGNWKAIGLADAYGALKGAWTFGRTGLALGGGAGAFTVGATGAIFEGAAESASAYLWDRAAAHITGS